MELQLGAAGDEIDSTLGEALSTSGYVPDQIVMSDFFEGESGDFDRDFVSGPDKTRFGVMVLPNFAEKYLPEFGAEAESLFVEDNDYAAEIVIDLGEMEVIPIDDDEELLALHVTPVSIEVKALDRSTVVYRTTYDVAALDPSGVAAEVEAPAPEADKLPFDAETVDLLIAKHIYEGPAGSMSASSTRNSESRAAAASS
jgi:hypothetical protein